jgi:AcrR family transcriptional regulator
MATPTTKPAKKRRTQAERRAATRTALLDATIDCLIDYGYANTTTNRIVERAGVSRGAQVHHYPTKASLVAEAVRHLAERRTGELLSELEALPEGRNRVKAALDLLWKAHSGPLFQASLELWVAARTDKELRDSLVPVEREISQRVVEISHEVFGNGGDGAELAANVQTSLAAVQGLALVGNLVGSGQRRDQEAIWIACRDRLITLFDE